MQVAQELTPFLRELFPRASAELLGLFAEAADSAMLLRSDFYSLRDWLEIADHGEHEALAALILVLLAALEEGSYCVEWSEASFTRRLADLADEDAARLWSKRILAIDDGQRLIGTSPRDHRPIIRTTQGDRTFVYFQKYLAAELDLKAQLDARLRAAGPAPDLEPLLAEVLEENPLRRADGGPLVLDADQLRAVRTALQREVTLISGGPGTGKTSIVLTLLRCLVRLGVPPDRIALAAPTGRAAQRLTDALRSGLQTLAGEADAQLHGLAASTLHQLLGYQPSRHLFSRHAENPIVADAVVVDEVSMVGLELMARLFGALAPSTRLILLGDRDQLPSVDPGAVLANLVSNPDAAHVVMLRTNHRSQAGIRAAAQAINAQDSSLAQALPALQLPSASAAQAWWGDLEASGGAWLLEQAHGTPHELHGFLQHWAERAIFGSGLAEQVAQLSARDRLTGQEAQALFARLERYRLLTLVREGPWGCDRINRALDQMLRPRLDPGARGSLFQGAPILITRNDATHGLFNGDVGLALRHQGRLSALFPRHDRLILLPVEALPPHELGFALTVHKSQGSEYANVLVVLPPEGGRRLLSKELVYTAITRAKSLAILCATRDVLELAIARAIRRESGVLTFSAP